MPHHPAVADQITVRLLLPADIPDAMALSRAAGWNQVSADWERLLELEPEGCFGLECDGLVAATTTAICYRQQLAWIGMVLTAPEFRRRGFAERLLHRALQFVEQRGVTTVKLDATEMGGNLYRKFGFVEECAIERWQRPPGRIEGAMVSPYRADPAYDHAQFGADRMRLLSQLAPLGSACVPDKGYAMGRAGFLAAYFGPCVGDSSAVPSLLQWFLAQHQREPVYWDLFPGNSEAVRVARDFGFAPCRHLVRMSLTKNSVSLPNYSKVFGIAGFEFG